MNRTRRCILAAFMTALLPVPLVALHAGDAPAGVGKPRRREF